MKHERTLEHYPEPEQYPATNRAGFIPLVHFCHSPLAVSVVPYPFGETHTSFFHRGQGQFPNYENVIPKAPLEAKVVFQREELLDGLTKLSPTARKAQNAAVKLELSKSPARIKAENDGTANQIALEHARVSGKARDIGVNHQYLTQYVKSLETDTVSMKLFPRAISEVIMFDSFRYQHLLMPIRD